MKIQKHSDEDLIQWMGIEEKYGDADIIQWGRRQAPVSVPLDNRRHAYFASVTVGTPPQTLKLAIDTGSSDTWVPWTNAPICRCGSSACCQLGTYDPKKSSTFKKLPSIPPFSITYVDGTNATGEYVTDVLDIGGAKLNAQQFAFVTNMTLEFGVLGIGLPALERAETKYPNLAYSLYSQGLIKSPTYSIWLNDLSSSSGQLLFGGVDRGKYDGELKTVDITQAGRKTGYLYVNVTELGISTIGDGGKEATQNIPFSAGDHEISVLLDTGNTLTNLQAPLFAPLVSRFGLLRDAGRNTYTAACSLAADTTTTVDFTFASDLTIRVPMSELVDQKVTTGGRCRFGIYEAAANARNVLGDTVLRSMVMVVDVAGMQVGIAQAKFGSRGQDVREIASVHGGEGVGFGVDAESGVGREGARPPMWWFIFVWAVMAFTY
ncbi:MAG: hypothetical protein M1839_002455 [Geoglossum umbratile]|nr:MAG: hypothetical protein M1839_002455 [Geoglossum umbratile]